MKLVKFVVDGCLYDVATMKGLTPSPDQSYNDLKVDSLSEGSEPLGNHPPASYNPAVGSGPGAAPQRLAEMRPMSKNESLKDFLRCLTTCHTVVREKTGTYRAESPDELALIEGVAPYG